jgi:hypothetical protein
MKTKDPAPEDEINRLLLTLDRNEAFKVWRDRVCLPILEQIDYQKRSVVEMSEANLKALIMYENLVKELFKKLFENVREIEKNERSNNDKD